MQMRAWQVRRPPAVRASKHWQDGHRTADWRLTGNYKMTNHTTQPSDDAPQRSVSNGTSAVMGACPGNLAGAMCCYSYACRSWTQSTMSCCGMDHTWTAHEQTLFCSPSQIHVPARPGFLQHPT